MPRERNTLLLDSGRSRNLIILGLHLEVALRMVADRADVGSLAADDDVAAVGALPDHAAVLGEDLAVLDVPEQLAVALLVMLLDFGDHFELAGDLVEALGTRLARHPGVHVRPFEVLAGGGVGQVGGRVGHLSAMEVLVPALGVLLLVLGRLLEEGGYLDETVLAGLGGEIAVFVAGLGLTGEGFLKVLLGFRAGQGTTALEWGGGETRGGGRGSVGGCGALIDPFELVGGHPAARASLRRCRAFVDIATDSTSEFAHGIKCLIRGFGPAR